MKINQEKLNELALFAGAGGGILGGHLLGWRTVCAVEWDAYAASILVARQNDKILPAFPIWDDVQTFDGRPWRGIVDVVSGGFPCQDISAAGKGAGITGERSGMWSHMARIIGEVLPRFVYVENSPMLVGRGLALVISDLTALGYDCKWGVLGADDVGAPHERKRLWLVANANMLGCNQGDGKTGRSQGSAIGDGGSTPGDTLANTNSVRQLQPQRTEQDERGRAGNSSQELPDTINAGAERREQQPERSAETRDVSNTMRNGCESEDGWESLHNELGECASSQSERDEQQQGFNGNGQLSVWGSDPAENPKSGVGRMADGVANRVDRLKAIGNGQVPAVAAAAWQILRGAA